jgi:osmotically-inducible protein OsmY
MKKLINVIAGGSLLVATLAIPSTARADVSDAELAARVVDAIQHYGPFGVFDDVVVSVDNRIVTLTGRVTRPVKKDDIAKRVARIDGIRELQNQIEVLPFSPSDDDLRLRVARAIYTHSLFWQYASMAQPPIHIIVEHGHVTLTGAVGTQLERTLASALAQVPGAYSVKNQLRVD